MLSVTSSSPRTNVAVAGRDLGVQRVPAGAAGDFTTNPPLAPTGTMTAFLTVWALASPRISVRKSSGRSDQRSPPRATGPPRRCTPSTRGEYTKISNIGRGRGRSGMLRGSSFSASRGPPSACGW